jgi:hypothetical protein
MRTGTVAAVFAALALAGSAQASPTHPHLDSLSQSGYGDGCGTVVDGAGDTYVSDFNSGVSVYDPSGTLLTTISAVPGPCGLAVDSAGNLYVNAWEGAVTKLKPSAYPPAASTTYSPDSAVNGTGVVDGGTNFAVAVDPSNDDVYLAQGDHISSYQPNGTLIDATIGTGVAGATYWGLDVFGADHDVYAEDGSTSSIYVFAGSDLAGHPKARIDGTAAPQTTPDGGLGFGSFGSGIAVDQATGHVFVFDVQHLVVDEFEASGTYVTQLNDSFADGSPSDIAVAPTTAPDAGAIVVLSATKLDAYGPLPVPTHPHLDSLSQSGYGDGCGTVVDGAGDTYVSDFNSGVSVYDPSGTLLTTISAVPGPCGLAVDSAGNLYVNAWEGAVTKLKPSAYPPAASTTYSPDSAVNGTGVVDGGTNFAVAVDPSNDDVYLAQGDHISSYQPNGTLIDATIGTGVAGATYWGLDVFGADHDVYAEDGSTSSIYVFAGSDLAGHPKARIDGTAAPQTTPDGGLGFGSFGSGIAVDQATGHVFVFDVQHLVVDEFEASGTYVTQLNDSFADGSPSDIAVAPTTAPDAGAIVVLSATKLDAYGPLAYGGPPSTQTTAATAVGPHSATLNGAVNPNHLPASDCHFEYVVDAHFKTDGFADASLAPCADPGAAGIGQGTSPVPVHADLSGLLLGRLYHFRLIARTSGGEVAGAERSFQTPPPTAAISSPTAISQNAATLHGSADLQGFDGTYSFEVAGVDNPYQSDTPASPVPPDGVVAASLDDLPSHGTFTVQLRVEAAGAAATSAPLTFSTPAAVASGPHGAGDGDRSSPSYGCTQPHIDVPKAVDAGLVAHVTGSDLGPAGSIRLGNLNLYPDSWSTSGVTFTVPAAAAGSTTLTLSCGQDSNTVAFTIHDNRFSVVSTRVRGASAQVTVRVPEAGRLRAAGSLLRTVSKSVGAGTTTIVLALSPTGHKRLLRARSHTLACSYTLDFTPRGGHGRSLTRRVTFARKGAQR